MTCGFDMRRLGLYRVALLAIAAALVAVGSAAGADPLPGALWTLPMGDLGSPVVTPAGNVLAAACGNGSSEYVTRAGEVTWSQAGIDCFSLVADSRDTTYAVTSTNDASNQAVAIDSTGHQLWNTPLPSGFVYFGSSAPALGWDGSVYFVVWNGRDFRLFGFDEATGAITLNLQLSSGVPNLFAYANGLIVVEGSNVVDYYDYDGSLVHEYVGPAIGDGYSTDLGANGAVYLAGYSGFCSEINVAKFTPTGSVWTWTEPAPETPCPTQTFVAATPDGGAILELARSPTDFISISPIGAKRWTHHTDNSPPGFYGAQPIVDVSGIVAMGTNYSYSCPLYGTCIAAQVEFATQESESPSLPTLTLTNPYQVSLYYSSRFSSLEIDTDRVYAYVYRADDSSSPGYEMSAFAVTGLGRDYRLVVGTPDIPPPPPPRAGRIAFV
jgi:hypothetical protein